MADNPLQMGIGPTNKGSHASGHKRPLRPSPRAPTSVVPQAPPVASIASARVGPAPLAEDQGSFPTPGVAAVAYQVTASDVRTLIAFLNQEALKIPRRFWKVLPFKPNPTLRPEPQALQTPFMERFQKAYRIACRVHGAPEKGSALSNVLAARELRQNGAPYIIHVIGVVWAAAVVGKIVDGRLLCIGLNHDVGENGVKGIRALQGDRISKEAAAEMIRREFDIFGDEAPDLLQALKRYTRDRKQLYGPYVDEFLASTLDELLLKLFDQGNNLSDISVLMAKGGKSKDRAQRQVGKTLRYFSKHIALPQHADDPRYRNGVLYLMKSLIQGALEVDWIDAYYERKPKSREPSEDVDALKPEMLEAITRFEAWMRQGWVRQALAEQQEGWGPAIDLVRQEHFLRRLAGLKQRIDEGLAVTAQYIDAKAKAKKRLSNDPEVLRVTYDSAHFTEGAAVVKLEIEEAVRRIGGLRTGAFNVAMLHRDATIILETAFFRPKRLAPEAAQAALTRQLRDRMGPTVGAQVSIPKDDVGDTEEAFRMRRIEPKDAEALRRLFQRQSEEGPDAQAEVRFRRRFRDVSEGKRAGFGLVWDERVEGQRPDLRAAALGVLIPAQRQSTLRIDALFDEDTASSEPGPEFLQYVAEVAQEFPGVRNVQIRNVPPVLGPVLRDLGFADMDEMRWTWSVEDERRWPLPVSTWRKAPEVVETKKLYVTEVAARKLRG